MLDIIQDFIPLNKPNRPSTYNPCYYITIHDTGNTDRGADALAHSAYLKATSEKVSWHFTVDDTVAVNHLPTNETAYHAGDGKNGTGNTKSIGIEICINADGDIEKATDNAAWLTAKLLIEHKLTIEKVVQHNRWSGKDCPQNLRNGVPYSWEVFLSKVEAYMQTYNITNATEAIDLLVAQNIITNGDYWKSALNHIKNHDSLFVKFAQHIL